MRNPNLDTVKQVVPGCIIRPRQSELESQLVRGAMAFKNQATQAQQGAAVVAAMIHAFFKRRYDGVSRNCSHFRENIARKLDFQEVDNHRRQAFTGLQSDIAHKTIAHNDVGGSLENIVALDVAIKIQLAGLGGSAQQLARFFDDFVAFDGLFANIEQTHRGVVVAAEHRHQSRAHHGKLEQVFG